jgi:hypothetical protein
LTAAVKSLQRSCFQLSMKAHTSLSERYNFPVKEEPKNKGRQMFRDALMADPSMNRKRNLVDRYMTGSVGVVRFSLCLSQFDKK